MAGGLYIAVVLWFWHQGRQDSISITAPFDQQWHHQLGPAMLCRVIPWVLRLPWGNKPAKADIPAQGQSHLPEPHSCRSLRALRGL